MAVQFGNDLQPIVKEKRVEVPQEKLQQLFDTVQKFLNKGMSEEEKEAFINGGAANLYKELVGDMDEKEFDNQYDRFVDKKFGLKRKGEL